MHPVTPLPSPPGNSTWSPRSYAGLPALSTEKGVYWMFARAVRMFPRISSKTMFCSRGLEPRLYVNPSSTSNPLYTVVSLSIWTTLTPVYLVTKSEKLAPRNLSVMPMVSTVVPPYILISNFPSRVMVAKQPMV